jgi:hypothetical protein
VTNGTLPINRDDEFAMLLGWSITVWLLKAPEGMSRLRLHISDGSPYVCGIGQTTDRLESGCWHQGAEWLPTECPLFHS